MANNTLLPLRILISARDTASGVLDRLKSNSAKVATAIVGFFSVAFFKKATDDAQAFEKQMSTVGAVSGATAEEMAKLEAAAKEMGATTQFTALESAQALEELARAGLSSAEQIQALPDVLSLAQANGLSLADSAGFITKTIIGLGLSFSDSGKAADVLTKAAASANTNVQGLGSALAYAAPLANTLGLSLEDTVGLLAQMANAGIDASRSGTALNAVMAQFINPSSKFKQELAALGIDTNNFNEALKQLALKGDAGNKAILSLGTEAGPAIRALFNQGVPALEGLQKALVDSAGASKEAADKMSANLDGAKRQLGSVVDAIKLQLAQPILEPLTNGIRAIGTGFQELLNGGSIDAVGQRIADTFSTAIQFSSELIGGIKAIYTELSDKGVLAAFSSAFDEAFDAIGSLVDTLKSSFVRLFDIFSDTAKPASFGEAFLTVLTKIVESVGFLVNAFSTGLATIETAFFGLSGAAASAFSFIIEGVGRVQSAMAKITFSGISQKWREAAAESRLISESFAQSAEINFKKAGAALGAVADNAKKTSTSVLILSGDIERTGTSTEQLSVQANKANTELNNLSSTAKKAGTEMQEALQKPVQSLSDLKIAQQLAINEYRSLSLSGTASAEQLEIAWQRSINATDALLEAVNRTSSGFDQEKQAAKSANSTITSGANSSGEAQDQLKSSVDSVTTSLNKQAEAAKKAAEQDRQLNEEYERNVASNRGKHTNNTDQFEGRSNRTRENSESNFSNGRRPDGQSSSSFSNAQKEAISNLSATQQDEFNRRLDEAIRATGNRIAEFQDPNAIANSVDFILRDIKKNNRPGKKLSFSSDDAGLSQAQRDQIQIDKANREQQEKINQTSAMAFKAREVAAEKERQRKLDEGNKADQFKQKLARLEAQDSESQRTLERSVNNRTLETDRLITAISASDQRADQRAQQLIAARVSAEDRFLESLEQSSRLS